MTTPRKLVKDVLKRDGGLCVIRSEYCTGQATTADHRANRGMGGSSALDAPECLIAACWACNGVGKEDAVGATREDLIFRGIRVLKAATNALTYLRCLERPVLYSDGWHVLSGAERLPMTAGEVAEYLALRAEEEVS